MKSERRHELQTNSLRSFLERTPDLLRAHGSKILLGVIIVLLAAILIYQRTRRNQEDLDMGWTNISAARTSLARLQVLPRYVTSGDQLAQARKQLIDGATSAVTPMLASDNDQVAAEAYLLLGDLNLAKANLPPIAAAATQPALQIEGTPEEHLARAQEAYEKVIRVYADQQQTATNARFGLATVAESKHDFDQAAKIYNEIKDGEHTMPAYKTLAQLRLDSLDEIKKPVYLVPASIPATAPIAAPAATTQK